MTALALLHQSKIAIVMGIMALIAVFTSSYVSAKTTAAAAPESGYAKDQCKNGGWQTLGFKNQGQCVSFFASGGKSGGAK